MSFDVLVVTVNPVKGSKERGLRILVNCRLKVPLIGLPILVILNVLPLLLQETKEVTLRTVSEHAEVD